MWKLTCSVFTAEPGIPVCGFVTTDLVLMQEHSMTEHHASRDDVRCVSRHAHGADHYEYISSNGRVHFEAKK